MRNEKLLLQQYIKYHPILHKDKMFRRKYVSLIKCICEDNSEDRIWSDSMIRLMQETIMDGGDFISVNINSKNSLILEMKKYKFYILTDALFINAFEDRKIGKCILEKISKLYPNDKNKIKILFDYFYQVDMKKIKKDFPKMEEIYGIIKSDREFLSKPEKRIMITANMSAGKSTLLNALIGKKVNKTQNVPCTAKIHYLYNKAGEDGFSYELDHDLELNATRQILMEDNEENDSVEIAVGTRFRSIKQIDSRVCFIDTPGVNSSQNKDHRELTYGTISDENCDLLICLLNGENIEAEDEVKHLQYVNEAYHGEILFLINKLDCYEEDEDSVPAIIEDVKDYLTKLGFEKPKVYPISAYAAYLAKMSIFGEKLTEHEMRGMEYRKRKLLWDEYRFDKYFEEEIPEIDINNENEVLLRNSGLLSLEKIIYNYQEEKEMRKIFIKHNPYRLETEIKIDGKPLKKDSKLNFEKLRLQEWIDELPELLLNECAEKEYEILFHGTILDYEDVVAMAEEAKAKGIAIKVEHIPAKEVKDKETAIREIFEEIQNGPFEELKKPDVVRAFEMAVSSDFEVDVVATMSAGKSTLINSLLGQKLMPSKQKACTAKITEIKDNDADHFSAKAYDNDGKEIESCEYLELSRMENYNSNPSISKIRAEGNIPFVTSDDISLILVDTPGPNNSSDPEHKAATYRMLSESSKAVVLYIMNGTQLQTTDDNNFLSHVADSMKVGGKQSRDRFIFVVNKLDDFDVEEDSIETSLEDVRKYLVGNGIENPNIYPASARTALNIRTILKNSEGIDSAQKIEKIKSTVNEFNTTEEKHFERYAPLPASVKRQVEDRLEEAIRKGDDNEQALIHSGIVSIEEAIRMYVRKYAKAAKIKNIADTFYQRIESAQTFETTRLQISENEEKKEEIHNRIEMIKGKIKNRQDYKKEVLDLKETHVQRLEEITNNIFLKAQKKIHNRIMSIEKDLTGKAAQDECDKLNTYFADLDAEVKVDLEKSISDCVINKATSLLEEYKNDLSELSDGMNTEDYIIDPFKIMKGEVPVIDKAAIHRWVINEDKKWYKPWTWRDPLYLSEYKIDKTILATKFLSPMEEHLRESVNSAKTNAIEKTEQIMDYFIPIFKKLDDSLNAKLVDLGMFVTDEKYAEAELEKSRRNLEWLEDIQNRVNEILDF